MFIHPSSCCWYISVKVLNWQTDAEVKELKTKVKKNISDRSLLVSGVEVLSVSELHGGDDEIISSVSDESVWVDFSRRTVNVSVVTADLRFWLPQWLTYSERRVTYSHWTAASMINDRSDQKQGFFLCNNIISGHVFNTNAQFVLLI